MLRAQAASAARVKGANDRLQLGFIGVGRRGTNIMTNTRESSAADNAYAVAVCDVWDKRVEAARAYLGGEAKGYNDYRRLLERRDIDAVVIATVDHWHARIAIEAMQAGKHVYVEKPMTRYLGEAFDIYDATKRTGKVLQVGAQGCADPRWSKAAELIRAGRLGPLVLAQGSYMRNKGRAGEWNYPIEPEATPQSLDWNAWVGPVAQRPFNADHYFRWRKYYPYCGGLLSDLLPHRLHPLMLATGNPEFPSRVTCLGTRKVSTDRDVTDNTQLLVEFPSGLSLLATSSTVNEQGLPDMIRGHQATLFFGGDRIELRPERPFSDELDPEMFGPMSGSINEHVSDWFRAIRTGSTPNGDIELAVRAQTVLSLAEISERRDVMCLFDEKTRRITTGDGRPVEPFTYENEPFA